jgi:nucleolar protein 9
LLDAVSKATDMGQATNPPKKRHLKDARENPLEPKVAGALLLQSLLNLSEPYNILVLDRFVAPLLLTFKLVGISLRSLQSMPTEDVIALAHHPTSSRVLDAVLDSPTVPLKHKRAFMQSLLGYYHRLVDDRIGSRVGDRCWATADTFLKVRPALHA